MSASSRRYVTSTVADARPDALATFGRHSPVSVAILSRMLRDSVSTSSWSPMFEADAICVGPSAVGRRSHARGNARVQNQQESEVAFKLEPLRWRTRQTMRRCVKFSLCRCGTSRVKIFPTGWSSGPGNCCTGSVHPHPCNAGVTPGRDPFVAA